MTLAGQPLSNAADAKGRASSPPAGVKAYRRVAELDGVRGLAILMVLFCHYVSMQLPEGGSLPIEAIRQMTAICFSGVDLFFVLSGFLLGGILMDNRASPHYYTTFYVRRFCRILPIYYAWVAIVFLLKTTSLPERMPLLFQDVGSIYPYLMYIQNVTYVATGVGSGGPLLSVTWSLAIEEQFYLILPFLLRRISASRLPLWLLLLAFSSTVFRLGFWFLGPLQGWAGYTLLPCRWDALFLGVLVAWYVRRPDGVRQIQQHQWFLYGVLGIISLAIILLRIGKQGRLVNFGMHLYGFQLMAIAYAILIALALHGTNRYLSGFFRMHWLVWLGGISYGLYLLHQPVSFAVHLAIWDHVPRITTWAECATTVGALAVALIVASLSWRYFESRVVAWGRKHIY